MTTQTSVGERPEIRVIVYALALIFPPLLAYNRKIGRASCRERV